jgi:hypothetical protein
MKGAKTMDNPMDTGNSYLDSVSVIFIWSMLGLDRLMGFIGFIGWGDTPVILACFASASVIVKNVWEMIEKKKQKRRK